MATKTATTEQYRLATRVDERHEVRVSDPEGDNPAWYRVLSATTLSTMGGRLRVRELRLLGFGDVGVKASDEVMSRIAQESSDA